MGRADRTRLGAFVPTGKNILAGCRTGRRADVFTSLLNINPSQTREHQTPHHTVIQRENRGAFIQLHSEADGGIGGGVKEKEKEDLVREQLRAGTVDEAEGGFKSERRRSCTTKSHDNLRGLS